MPILERTGRRSLTVDEGEIVSILGSPGSGKTALALDLAFLSRPTEGEVLLRGVDPMTRKHRFDMPKRPRDVTMLVQNAEDQLFARTVYDDVAFGPNQLRLPPEETRSRVTMALKAVRLNPEDVCGRSPFELSGGERRRVALAGVLAMRPQILILDEPTANLDPRTRNEFLDLLGPLRGSSGIVWFTARAREAMMADRIYLLREGRTTEIPTGSDLMHEWRELARAGIELPGVYELAYALEQRGYLFPASSSAAVLQTSIIDNWRRQRHDR